jgi:chorismate mutase
MRRQISIQLKLSCTRYAASLRREPGAECNTRMKMTLEELRKQIDALDLQLVELLNKRARTVLKIGHLKAAYSMPVHEPAREKVVYANARAANKGPLPNIELTRIFERLIDVMRSLEMHESDVEKNAQAVAPGLATDAEASETGKKQ